MIFIGAYNSCFEVVNFGDFQSDYCWLLFRVIMMQLFGNGCFIFFCCNFLGCFFEIYKVKNGTSMRECDFRLDFVMKM